MWWPGPQTGPPHGHHSLGPLRFRDNSLSAQVAFSWLGEWRPHLTSLPSPRGAPRLTVLAPCWLCLWTAAHGTEGLPPQGTESLPPSRSSPRGLSEAGLEWWRGRKTRCVAQGSWCLRDPVVTLLGSSQASPKRRQGVHMGVACRKDTRARAPWGGGW